MVIKNKCWTGYFKYAIWGICFIGLLLIASLSGGRAKAESEEFVIRDGELIEYNGPGGDIVIPEGVERILNGVFYCDSRITSVTFPVSIKEIGSFYLDGDGAYEYGEFYGCTNLREVVFKEGTSLDRIGSAAFRNCTSLTEISLSFAEDPDIKDWIGIYSGIIGDYAFADCTNLKRAVINSNFYEAGHVFENCINLTTVSLANECHMIGEGMFQNCSSLSEITIPEGVTKIGRGAFFGCSSLTSITIPESVTEIGPRAFYGCVSLKDVPKRTVKFPEGTQIIHEGEYISIVLPEYLDYYDVLEDYAFSEIENLKSVTFTGPLYGYYYGLFADCTALEEVIFPSGEYFGFIGGETFENCSSLTSITIPESVTCIDWYAFEGCSSLTSITIPESVMEIGEGAFSGCSSLTSITIPESVTKIGQGAFSGCSSLTSITIPDSVTEIDAGAFSRCSSLTSITLPSQLKTIENLLFNGCYSLTSITIPDSVVHIGMMAFGGTCIQSIVIPKNVSSFAMLALVGNNRSITFLGDVNESESTLLVGGAFEDNSAGIINSGDYAESVKKDLVIVGHRGSNIEKIAKREGIKFIVIEDAETIDNEIEAVGSNVSLSDMIDFKFYFDLDHTLFENGRIYASIYNPNSESVYKWSAIEFDNSITQVYEGRNLYGIRIPIAAKEVNDVITIQLWDSVTATPCSDKIEYSVKYYCDKLLESSEITDVEKTLVDKMLTYTTYSQMYFDYHEDTPVKDIEECVTSKAADVFNQVKDIEGIKIEGILPAGIEFYGCSLVLNSSIEYRMYFKVNSDSEKLAKQYGLKARDTTDLYYWENVTTSIVQLGQDKSCQIGDASITSKPICYVQNVLANNSDAELSALTLAIYDYYKAAMDVFEYYNYGKPIGNETEIVY